jgi:MFS family permease
MATDNQKLWVALAVMLLASIGLALPYPVLTPLFINAAPSSLNSWLGFSGTQLFTAILAIYPLGIFIGSSFIGAISDRYGRKKTLLYTLWVCATGYTISTYALIQQDYLLLLLSRFFTGITEGNVAIARAIALDIGGADDSENREAKKIKAISLINSSMFMGWLLGPLVGGILANFEPYFAFVAASVGALFAVWLVHYWLEETAKVIDSSNKIGFWRSAIQDNSLFIIKEPWYRKVFVMYCTYTLAINLFYEFYPVWLVAEHKFGSLEIGLSTTNMTIFMTLASLLLVTKVQAKYGLIQPMLHLKWLLALSLLMLPFSDVYQAQLLFAITGIFIAVFNGLMPVYVSERSNQYGNGAVMGLLTMTFCLANVIAALFGGMLLGVNAKAPLIGASVLFLVSMFMFYLWFGRTANHKQTKLT